MKSVASNKNLRLAIMLVMLLVLAGISLGFGGVFSAGRLFSALLHPGGNDIISLIVWEIRLPRILLAICGGAGLALAGAALQGILMNPLVDPYILGVSSGASFGAALAIVLGISLDSGSYWLVGNAFVMACVVALLVFGLARSRQASAHTIILAGLAMNFIFSALVAGLQFVARESQLRDLMFWMMGSLWNATFESSLLISIVLALALVILISQAWNLNAMAAGVEVAQSLGVKTGRVNLIVILTASLLTAVVVAFMGAVGFVGLLGPHMARAILGSDHRFLLPAAGLCGALLLLLADICARHLLWPMDLPVGIMTALLGGPFFIYLLLKGRKNWWM